MHNRCFTGHLVIAPENVASIVKHIFPDISCKAGVYNTIRNIPVLHKVNPTKNRLVRMKLGQIVGITDFRVTDNVFFQDFLI